MNGARALTEDECLRIKAVLAPRDRCLFVLGIRTGFRISELLSLNIRDVYDLQSFSVLNSVHLKKRNTKGKQAGRTVPMHPESVTAILAWLESHPNPLPDSPLFQSIGGNRLTKWDGWFILKKALTRASIRGEQVSTHSMRKTFAERMNEQFKGNIYKLKEAMGHASITSTEKYIDVDSKEIWNAIKNSK